MNPHRHRLARRKRLFSPLIPHKLNPPKQPLPPNIAHSRMPPQPRLQQLPQQNPLLPHIAHQIILLHNPLDLQRRPTRQRMPLVRLPVPKTPATLLQSVHDPVISEYSRLRGPWQRP